MTRIYTIILASCIALLLAASDTVATQETVAASAPTEMAAVATPTMASESSNETTYYGNVAGDRMARIAPAEYIGGTVVLVLESNLPRTVTVTVPTGSTLTGAAARNLARRPIPPERTTIRIDSPEPRVTLATSYSAENGRYTEIRSNDGNSALVVGPFTGTGVRDAAIGSALGTSFSAPLIIIRRRFGLHRDMERVARVTTPKAQLRLSGKFLTNQRWEWS